MEVYEQVRSTRVESKARLSSWWPVHTNFSCLVIFPGLQENCYF